MVRIVDVTVPYDNASNFRSAAQATVDKYEPILQVILEIASNEGLGRSVEGLIVPVIVGTPGVIQTNWCERTGGLLILQTKQSHSEQG